MSEFDTAVTLLLKRFDEAIAKRRKLLADPAGVNPATNELLSNTAAIKQIEKDLFGMKRARNQHQELTAPKKPVKAKGA